MSKQRGVEEVRVWRQAAVPRKYVHRSLVGVIDKVVLGRLKRKSCVQQTLVS